MDKLGGKVAFVTGGGRGIGRAIALALARAGADVAVSARTRSEVDAVASEIRALGRRSTALRLDVTDRQALAAVPASVERAVGPIDILVNNAGMHVSASVGETTDAQWDAVLSVNVTAPFLLSRACLPSMSRRGFGRIINVASVAGKIGVKFGAAYAASKHGLIGLTRTLALEGPRRGVTANAICPSWTETRLMNEAVSAVRAATGRTEAEARALLLQGCPVGRAATPEQVAEAVLLVACNGAINGQAIHVDGGEVMA